MGLRWNEITALFGGTFDPRTLGIGEAIRGLFELPGIRQVIVLPSGAPHKPSFTPVAHRVRMAELNFSATPLDPNYPREIAIDPREAIAAERSGLPSYSFNTLQALKPERPELAFVIGTDQLRDLPKWWRFPEVLGLCHWLVLERRPADPESLRSALSVLEASGLIRSSASSGPGNTWQISRAGTFLSVVPTQAPALSSTQIREAIAKHGAPEGTLLPEISAYLKQNQLYGTYGAS